MAKEIGVSSATLLRVESGRVPDVETFGKLCRWLGRDPGEFLGTPLSAEPETVAPDRLAPVQFSAHFRADREPVPATMDALARMLLLAAQSQRQTERPGPDESSSEGV